MLRLTFLGRFVMQMHGPLAKPVEPVLELVMVFSCDFESYTEHHRTAGFLSGIQCLCMFLGLAF